MNSLVSRVLSTCNAAKECHDEMRAGEAEGQDNGLHGVTAQSRPGHGAAGDIIGEHAPQYLVRTDTMFR